MNDTAKNQLNTDRTQINDPATAPAPQSFEPQEADFYMDGENLVFTESYLKRRGHCCNNGCRHCPYRLEKS